MMSWEKMPLLGGMVALMLTLTFIRMIFIVPEFSGFFWDVFFYIILAGLDIYLVDYKDTVYWRPFCYTVITVCVVLLVIMPFYPKEAGVSFFLAEITINFRWLILKQ